MTSISRKRRAKCCDATGADALMIGRAAQGRPWIFREILPLLLDSGEHLPSPAVEEIREVILEHLMTTIRCMAKKRCAHGRKHLGWYWRSLAGGAAFRA